MKVVDIAVHGGMSVALTADGKIYEWGHDRAYYQQKETRPTPILIASIQKFIAMSLGGMWLTSL